MKHLFIVLMLTVSSTVSAVDIYQLPNPEQQIIYESLTSQLRCLVCQNQTIADSNAELAGDLRRQVFEMLKQGKSRDEIVQFMTDRYGDFVLYNPPLKAKTGLLWIGPIVFLVVGLTMIFWVIRRKKQATVVGLDREKQQKIRHLLENVDNKDFL